jgi:hypothetical protein
MTAAKDVRSGLILRVEGFAGMTIEEAAQALWGLAVHLGITVAMLFNDVELMMPPDGIPTRMLAHYRCEIDARLKASKEGRARPGQTVFG